MLSGPDSSRILLRIHLQIPVRQCDNRAPVLFTIIECTSLLTCTSPILTELRARSQKLGRCSLVVLSIYGPRSAEYVSDLDPFQKSRIALKRVHGSFSLGSGPDRDENASRAWQEAETRSLRKSATRFPWDEESHPVEASSREHHAS